MTTKYLTKQEAGLVREKKQVVVDRELEKLYEKNAFLTPALVLDAARDRRHPLHRFFEWDDEKAAEKYRLEQARTLIMASKMVVLLKKNGEGDDEILSAAPQVRRLLPAPRGEGFKMRNEVLDEKETRDSLIAHKKEALRSWCRSVVDIEELSTLRELIIKEVR